MPPSRPGWPATITLLCSAVLASGAAADQFSESGWDDLVERLGIDNIPTGAGVVVAQVEVPVNGHYAPDGNHDEFDGKEFFLESGQTGGDSNHATNVGRNIYGLETSIAPGITTIHNWEVNNWVGAGFLHFLQGGNTPPDDVGEIALFNHSWVGNASNTQMNDIMRRIDFVATQQNALMIAGMNNGSGSITQRLLSHQYNGLTIGKKNGSHEAGNTLDGLDGPGRMKPEITAPRGTTSTATALASAAYALMTETARNAAGPGDNITRSEVIKAALLAGAQHRPNWSNNPIDDGPGRGIAQSPLDPVDGAGVVNVNQSHMILTGGEHDGTELPPSSGTVPTAGWDLITVPALGERYWRFEVIEQKPRVSILVTWHRQVSPDFSGFDIANFDLELFAVDDQGMLSSIVGDAGLDVFAEGNILSASGPDNVEHLFIRGLEPGSYALELRRLADGQGEWDAAVAWWMNPNDSEPALLEDFIVLFGTHISGDLADLAQSDDSFLVARSRPGFFATEPNVMEMAIGYSTLMDPATLLSVTVESRINNPAGTAKLRLENWITGNVDEVAEYEIGFAEETKIVSGIEAADYVRSGDGRIELNIKHIVPAILTAQGFDSSFDFAAVDVE